MQVNQAGVIGILKGNTPPSKPVLTPSKPVATTYTAPVAATKTTVVPSPPLIAKPVTNIPVTVKATSATPAAPSTTVVKGAVKSVIIAPAQSTSAPKTNTTITTKLPTVSTWNDNPNNTAAAPVTVSYKKLLNPWLILAALVTGVTFAYKALFKK